RPSAIFYRDLKPAHGMASAHPATRPLRSSTSSTRNSTRRSPIPRSRRGLPILEARSSVARPPISASSSPPKPTNGPRSSGQRTSSQSNRAALTFHNVPISESSLLTPLRTCGRTSISDVLCHKQTHALQHRLYSITSSARAHSVGGTSRPSLGRLEVHRALALQTADCETDTPCSTITRSSC